MTRGLALAVSLVIMLALTTGCGGSDEPREVVETGVTETAPMETEPTETPFTVACKAAPRSAINNIEFGLTQGGSLRGAKFVDVPLHERNSQGWPEWLVAARIHGEIGVWAVSRNGDGPIAAIDDIARTYTDWGTAAQPGSPARDAQDELRSGDAYNAAFGCVG